MVFVYVFFIFILVASDGVYLFFLGTFLKLPSSVEHVVNEDIFRRCLFVTQMGLARDVWFILYSDVFRNLHLSIIRRNSLDESFQWYINIQINHSHSYPPSNRPYIYLSKYPSIQYLLSTSSVLGHELHTGTKKWTRLHPFADGTHILMLDSLCWGSRHFGGSMNLLKLFVNYIMLYVNNISICRFLKMGSDSSDT